MEFNCIEIDLKKDKEGLEKKIDLLKELNDQFKNKIGETQKLLD